VGRWARERNRRKRGEKKKRVGDMEDMERK
jgi:hypothetical protein